MRVSFLNQQIMVPWANYRVRQLNHKRLLIEVKYFENSYSSVFLVNRVVGRSIDGGYHCE
jgi:hypothetical protein